MWQKLKAIFIKPLPAPVSRNNVLIITAYPKKGVITVSHKGKVRTGYFEDNTLRMMVAGVKFEENAEEFLTAAGKLIHQVIN
jgi:hypothetical protein